MGYKTKCLFRLKKCESQSYNFNSYFKLKMELKISLIYIWFNKTKKVDCYKNNRPLTKLSKVITNP